MLLIDNGHYFVGTSKSAMHQIDARSNSVVRYVALRPAAAHLSSD